MSYEAPDTTIHQTLAQSSPTVGRRNVLVVGPQIELQLNDGRDMDKSLYLDSTKTDPDEIVIRKNTAGVWANLNLTTHTVDETSLALYGENLMALTNDAVISAFDKEGTNKLRIAAGAVYLAPGYGGVETLNVGLDGRAMKIGDVLEISADLGDPLEEKRTRKVVALLPAVTASSYTEVDISSGSWLHGTPGEYTGTVARTYYFEVLSAPSASTYVIRIMDSAGIMATVERTVTELVSTEAIPGVGLLFGLPNDLVPTDTYSISVVPAGTSTEVYDGVLLDGPLPAAASVEVNIFQPFSGLLSTDHTENYGVEPFTYADGVMTLVELGLSSADSGSDTAFIPFIAERGKVFPVWKAVRLPVAGEDVEVVSLDTVADTFGEVNYANNLASCAYSALVGVSDSPTPPPQCAVFGLRTTGSDAESITAALATIKGIDIYYAIVAATDVVAAQDVIRDHAVAYSQPKKKMWRKAYIGTDTPGEYEVWGVLDRGTKLQAELLAGVVTIIPEDEGIKSFVDDAAIGDFITIGGLEGQFKILEIISANEVEVEGTGITNLIGGISLIRAASIANTRKFLRDRATALRNRRAANVWCDRPVDAAGVVIPNMNLAAYEAGARVGSISQLGRTRGKVSIVASCASMYSTFDETDLNDIADAGTYIITQTTPSGPVYVRHQLTTERTLGLLYSEDNITVIVDEYSFQHKDIIDAFLGVRNATKWSISELRTELRALATSYTQVDKKWTKYGPPVVSFFNEDGIEGEVTVKQDTVLADHLYTYTKLRVPVAINGIVSYIDIEVSFNI